MLLGDGRFQRSYDRTYALVDVRPGTCLRALAARRSHFSITSFHLPDRGQV